MAFITNIDSIKVKIRKSFLYQDNQKGFEKAYLIAIKAIPNRCLMFTAHLESGALFCNIPITELICERYNPEIKTKSYSLRELQPYSCLQGDIQVIKYSHLKDCGVVIKEPLAQGHYLFTVDYLGEGLSEDPEQYKTHQIIVLADGQIGAFPNNYLLFKDEFFTDRNIQFPGYKRNKKYVIGPA